MALSENTSVETHAEKAADDRSEHSGRSLGRRTLFTQGLMLGASVMGLNLLDGRVPVAEAAVAVQPKVQETCSELPTTRLHTCARATDGNIYHTIRYPGGSWQSSFGNVNEQESNGKALRFMDVACGGMFDSLHVTAVTREGSIWHTIRYPDGSWQPAFGNVNDQASNGPSLHFSGVSCDATPSYKLQITGLTKHGAIWHTIRYPDGSWQPAFGNVNDQASNGPSLHFTAVNCTTIDENLHVCAISKFGTIWHTIRFANGSWQSSFGNVNEQESNGRGMRFTSVGCTSIDDNLHVTATDVNGTIWHTIRFANGSWQSSFGNVNSQQNNAGALRFSDVTCANVADTLQVTAIGQSNALWHTVRFANGSWQPTIGNVNHLESNGGTLNFTSMSNAGVV